MARIVLIPGERFEHSHLQGGWTKLVQGDAVIHMRGATTALTDQAVETPPDVSHTVENVGSTEAIVDCLHEVRPPDDPG